MTDDQNPQLRSLFDWSHAAAVAQPADAAEPTDDELARALELVSCGPRELAGREPG